VSLALAALSGILAAALALGAAVGRSRLEVRRLRAEAARADAMLKRIVEAIDEHLYTDAISASGERRTVFVGPNRDKLMGGRAPFGAETAVEWSRLIHPDDRAAYARHAGRLERGEPSELEYRLVGYDGVTRWVHARTRPQQAGDRLLLVGIASDVTRRRRADEALRRSEARFRAIYEGAAIGIAILRDDGTISESNKALCDLLGRLPREVISTTYLDHTHPDDRRLELKSFERLMSGESDRYRVEKRFLDAAGDIVWADVTGSLVRDVSGRPDFVIQMVLDIREQKAAADELRAYAERHAHQALHDPLTGIPNRVLFRDRLERAMLQASRDGRGAAAVVIDLDGFKEVNDAFGHHAGDELLVQVAARLREALRGTDTVARLGGDEFGLVLPGQGERSKLMALLDDVHCRMLDPVELEGRSIQIGASMGVALSPHDGSDVETLLRRADAAMYAAKDQRRRYAFHDSPADS
jgi:diguanylate cyclase (GGDEF)-like protein/PAS domain S-box-containing protein